MANRTIEKPLAGGMSLLLLFATGAAIWGFGR